MKKQKHMSFKYFVRTLSIVVGLVMVWRGVWYVLDEVDVFIFGAYNHWTGLIGVILGLFLLYIPDHDLKEIEKL
jgi:hypothetical protein